MEKKIKLKKVPFVIFILFLIPILVISFKKEKDLKVEEPDIPVIVEDHDRTIPVISENNYIGQPFNNPNVTIGRDYYDYKEDDEKKQNSIMFYDNTYYQNTGIDYISENKFDVLSILEGTVLQIKEDDKTGKEVEIEHKDGLISIYQSLSEVSVKKGDSVIKGQILGKSGTNEIDKDLGNHLHFEMYENGKTVNPNHYLNKEYKKEN